MISVVVCSRLLEDYNRLEKNIISTIGNCEFELIRIDNGSNKYSIAAAYNEGIKQANYSFLLFIHEDVHFHTSNWGAIFLKIFKEDEKIGLIGIAGSRIKTKTPTAWWENTRENLVMNLIQQFPDGQKERIQFGFEDQADTEVVCVDGVLLAMRKTMNIEFDERLTGFHNYDQAISMRCREKGFKIVVTKNVLIEHFSVGNKDKNWLRSNSKFYDLYKTYLPCSVEGKIIANKEKAYSHYRLMLNYKGKGERLKLLSYFLQAICFDPFNKSYYREGYKIFERSFK